MEAVETQQRHRNTEINGGKGRRTMEDNVTPTSTPPAEEEEEEAPTSAYNY